ncbi:hypothetical protein SAMN04487788_1499 [Microbacterium testaceum StLB037]|uniref:Uncharacterized protein n=1 Tax=Microbacterium testaceum (strain StLB037) TaxID=979556 RepID=A0A1H0NRL3_MICTS|nr:hypothetical protein [Microbacterium testaceum]SDO95226.1 hypothetical protein SAMN04487788_1499 [Microbacterium testaceum StLB037]
MSTAVAPGTTFSGSRVIESGRALADAVKSGNWLDGGMAFLDTLGDAAAALTDPIGTLTACGLGWVMEHLKPLSTWLDQLAGSASNVASVASQWVSAGSSMRQAGADLTRRLSDLEGMTGGSITAYVRFATDAAKHLGASGEWAEAAASGLTSASTLVTKMQGVVKSAISKVVATAIEAMAVVAASFGLGMGYAIARVVMKVNEMVNKVVRPLRAVLGSVKALTGLVQQLRGVFDRTSTTTAAALQNSAQTIRIDSGTVVDASDATRYGNNAAHDLTVKGRRADGVVYRPFAVSGEHASGDFHLSSSGGLSGAPTPDGAVIGQASLGGSGGAGGSLGGLTGLDAKMFAGVHSGSTGALIGGTTGGAAMAATSMSAAQGTGPGGLRPPMTGAGTQHGTGAGSRQKLGQRRRDLRVVIEDD